MVTTGIPDRIRWAVEMLEISPSDEILEIGCGPGGAVSLVCDRLGDGHITAIDRSATAVRRTSERNAEHIASGTAIVEHADLIDLAAEERRFDKIFAVNVNVFWVHPEGPQLSILENLLQPGGRVYLFYAAPDPVKADQAVRRVVTELRRHGFQTWTSSATEPAATVRCVMARVEPQ